MISYTDIQPYIEKGLVLERAHPENPDVRIFNYTQTCQFSQSWDDITVQCRGLILNVKTGEVLARPFRKFFNYQEHKAKNWDIPEEQPTITEKLDGSLGVLYHLNGKDWIATRGSFMSDQAIWATKWWRDNMPQGFDKGYTCLFEIIYPQNRIVVNYDFSGLVYICTLDNTTGSVTNDQHFNDTPPGIRRAKTIGATSLEQLESLDTPNSEGFVAYYPMVNVRIKLKFPEYVRLHKLVTGLNELSVWEHLKQHNNIDSLIESVPDEFFNWVSVISKKLTEDKDMILADSYSVYKKASKMPTRKDQASLVMTEAPKLSGIIFCLLDNELEKAQQLAWKMVRPHGNNVFKTNIDLWVN